MMAVPAYPWVQDQFQQRNYSVFIDNFTAICDYLQNNVGAGDLVVTMGAGDIWKVANEYIQRLSKDN